LDGRPLTEFESDKARALLIYLAMDVGRPHRREQLSALFWTEQDEKGALQNLRKTLHRLRQTLGYTDRKPGLGSGQSAQIPDSPLLTSFLLITPQSVQFNADSDYELDVHRFQALIAETKHHRHRRLEACRSCIERLTRAIQLYRGDFLAGFSIKDSPDFDEWVALHRERLCLQALDALSSLAAYHECRNEDATAIDYARRQLELEAWQEEAHRLLMRALARDGNRAAALAQYQTCQRILMKELGIEPEPDTTALYEQIKTARMTDFSKKSVILHFPARVTSFVGREHELARISEALQDPDCRLLTLIGTGGSGKTRLAVEAAMREAGAFEDGACFVALASLASSESIPAAVASALGMLLLPSQDPMSQVFRFLRDKDMLLVLDNAEHLLNEANASPTSLASFVSGLMQACQKVVILATSRERLRLYGERELQVLPLPTPRLEHAAGGLTASALARFPAVELFVQRAQAVNASFRLDDSDAAAVGEICDRLDGLPLAIELAAARSKFFTPREMALQLNHRLAFLKAGARDLPARQETLWNTVDWSYGLLAPREQALFRRLAVFAGGFTRTAAEAICNADGAMGRETFDARAALVDKSLIYRAPQQSDGAGRADNTGDRADDFRCDMLETLREYAQVKLEEAPRDEGARVRDEHVRYFCLFAEETEHRMLHGQMKLAVARFEREHDNLRAALTWAYERGHFEIGLRLVGALSRFWRSCGYLDEGSSWSARMLAAGAQASPAVRARALLGAAEMARIVGRNDEARAQAESSLVLYRAVGDQAGAAYALTVLGALAHYAKAREHATRLLVEAEALFRAVDDPRGLGYALLWLGDVRLRMGDLAWAARCFAEALPIFRALDDRMYVSWALGGLGDIARLQGDYAKAEAAMKEALDLHLQVNNRYGMPFPIEALTLVAIAQGQDERAAMLWGIAQGLRHMVNIPVPASYLVDYEPHIAQARARLGEAIFDEMKAEGRALPFEQAIEFVLRRV
jgi:predicted ATPase/DNA-binding SARP family transcriptional activator